MTIAVLLFVAGVSIIWLARQRGELLIGAALVVTSAIFVVLHLPAVEQWYATASALSVPVRPSH